MPGFAKRWFSPIWVGELDRMGMGSRMSMTGHLPRCEIGWHFVVEIEVESNGFRFQNRFIHHGNEKTSRGSTSLTMLSLSSLTWLIIKYNSSFSCIYLPLLAAAAASSAQFPNTNCPSSYLPGPDLYIFPFLFTRSMYKKALVSISSKAQP